jgi:hypothetical protein
MGKVTDLEYIRRMYHQNLQFLSRLSLQVERFLFWNYWNFGLCPSTCILKTRKHNISETGCFRSQVRGEKLLEKANRYYWVTHAILVIAKYTPETRLSRSVIARTYAVKIMKKRA